MPKPHPCPKCKTSHNGPTKHCQDCIDNANKVQDAKANRSKLPSVQRNSTDYYMHGLTPRDY